jgi:hypothetical protein
MSALLLLLLPWQRKEAKLLLKAAGWHGPACVTSCIIHNFTQ